MSMHLGVWGSVQGDSMTNDQLIIMIRRYLNEIWKREERLVRHGSAWAGRKAEYDGAVKALDLLQKNLTRTTPAQSTLEGTEK